MEETLQYKTTTQCSGLPPTSPGNHRPDGPKAGHALTIKLDHQGGADHDDAADYLFFSALLHQGTTYPASYLSIPHLLRLAENLSGEPRLMTANLLGGLALAGQQPAHTDYSGVSCAHDNAWLATPVGQAAAAEFEKSLPQIGALCILAYKADPSCYFASGLAAAKGEVDLATWLTIGDNGDFQCPTCDGDHEWWLLDAKMGIYRNDDVFGTGADWLGDYDNRVF